MDNIHQDEPKQPAREIIDRSTLGLIGRLVSAILVAYPVGGALYAIAGLTKLAFTDPAAFLKHLPIDLFMIFLWMLLVPSCAGFVPQNEGDVGPRINMYPWIIPTAVVLFFMFSAGWRWFRRK